MANKESHAANNEENQAAMASEENPPAPANEGIMLATVPTDETEEATTEVSEPAQSTMPPPSHPAVFLQPPTPQTSQEAAAAQQQILLEVLAVATLAQLFQRFPSLLIFNLVPHHFSHHHFHQSDQMMKH